MDTTTTIHGFKARCPALCDREHWLVGRNGALTITARKAGPDLFDWIEFRISNDGSVPGELPYTGCALESALAVPGATWTTITNAPVLTNSTWRITIPASEPSLLFRLRIY
jgi:hypothetical protein